MSEGNMHLLIKSELAKSFSNLGYKTEIEKRLEYGRADLMISKGDESFIIEVIETHMPEWFGVKIKSMPIYADPEMSMGDRCDHLNVVMKKSVVEKLDKIRGDFSRSTYLAHLVTVFQQ